jgi:hypothetical protein
MSRTVYPLPLTSNRLANSSLCIVRYPHTLIVFKIELPLNILLRIVHRDLVRHAHQLPLISSGWVPSDA